MKKYSTDVAKALLDKYFYNKDYTPSEEWFWQNYWL
jgi:hypothetical protein